MTEKARVATPKATMPGGAKAPPKDPAAIVAEKMAAADAAEKAAKEQRVVATSEQQAEEAGEVEADEQALESKEAAKQNLVVSPEDDLTLAQAEQIWKPRDAMDVDARHGVGLLLHTTYFSGDKKRAEHGKKIMKIAELRLGIAISELYRMVKFAEKFSDLAAFREQYPDENWSFIKDNLLPDKPKGGRKRNAWQSRIEQFNELVELMLREQDELKRHVSPAELESFREKVADLNKAVALVIIPGQVFDADGKPIAAHAQPATT